MNLSHKLERFLNFFIAIKIMYLLAQIINLAAIFAFECIEFLGVEKPFHYLTLTSYNNIYLL